MSAVFSFLEPGNARLLGWFLRFVAVCYALGALVHAGNLLGMGHASPNPPTLFRVLDVVYLVLDVAVGWGLWTRRSWGVMLLLVAAVSQLVLYLGFTEVFATTDDERGALRGLVQFHVATLAAYSFLRWMKE